MYEKTYKYDFHPTFSQLVKLRMAFEDLKIIFLKFQFFFNKLCQLSKRSLGRQKNQKIEIIIIIQFLNIIHLKYISIIKYRKNTDQVNRVLG